MKKVLLSLLVASSLFAGQCEFWLNNYSKSFKVFLLSVSDGDYDAARSEYVFVKDYSRRAIAHCIEYDSTIAIIKSSRKTTDNIIKKIGK